MFPACSFHPAWSQGRWGQIWSRKNTNSVKAEELQLLTLSLNQHRRCWIRAAPDRLPCRIKQSQKGLRQMFKPDVFFFFFLSGWISMLTAHTVFWAHAVSLLTTLSEKGRKTWVQVVFGPFIFQTWKVLPFCMSPRCLVIISSCCPHDRWSPRAEDISFLFQLMMWRLQNRHPVPGHGSTVLGCRKARYTHSSPADSIDPKLPISRTYTGDRACVRILSKSQVCHTNNTAGRMWDRRTCRQTSASWSSEELHGLPGQ